MERPASDRVPRGQEWWWVFDPRQSIRARTALLCGVGAGAVTLSLGWLASARLHHALEAQQGAALETMAVQIGDKIDRTVYERYRTLRLAATLDVFRRRDVPSDERRQAVTALQDSAAEYAWIGFLDTKGRVIAASGGLHEGRELGQQPWFLGAQERPYAGPVRDQPDVARSDRNAEDPDAPARFFELAVPVTGETGRLAGVLAARVRWSWARDVQLSVVPETVLQTQVSVTIYASPTEVLLDTGNTGWSEPPPPPAIPDSRRFRGAIVERPEGSGSYLTGYARSRGFREYRGQGWFIVVRQPAGRVFAPVARLRQSFLGWGLLLMLAAMAGGWLFARRAARELRKVRAAAERIHDGDVLTVLPQPHDRSEMARMCAALGEMVQDLRARNEALATDNARLRARSASPAEPTERRPGTGGP